MNWKDWAVVLAVIVTVEYLRRNRPAELVRV